MLERHNALKTKFRSGPEDLLLKKWFLDSAANLCQLGCRMRRGWTEQGCQRRDTSSSRIGACWLELEGIGSHIGYGHLIRQSLQDSLRTSQPYLARASTVSPPAQAEIPPFQTT